MKQKYCLFNYNEFMNESKLQACNAKKLFDKGCLDGTTWQSNITQTYKLNTLKAHITMYYVYIIAHLYESDSYYHEKVNFRLFNFKY